MEVKNNFPNFHGSQIASAKNKIQTNSILFSEIKSKRNYKKNTYSAIRKNLISITKEDIKNSKELVIKSYKEDLDFDNLYTNDSLNIKKKKNNNDDNIELDNKEIIDLEYSKNKYADKNCSSSNMSD